MSNACSTRPYLPSQLFASCLGFRCQGDQECHWCSAPCDRTLIHDDPPPLIGVKRQTTRRPSSPYLCRACWEYRKTSVTLFFLSQSEFRDRQSLAKHSWLCTQRGIWGIRPNIANDAKSLYTFLLDPPLQFCLSLITGTNGDNLLQLSTINNFDKILADTPLRFTLDGVSYRYTIYELEQSVKTGEVTGLESGIPTLQRLFGPCPKELVAVEEKIVQKGKPRLDDGKITKMIVRPPVRKMSG